MSTSSRVYLAASPDALGEVAQRAVREAAVRRGGVPRVVVSYAAIAGEARARKYMERFAHDAFAGAVPVTLAVHGEKGHVSNDEGRALVASADLIFLSGGDPIAGAELLAAAGADAWIRDAAARGVPCVGVSAGAIMLCALWGKWPEDEAHAAGKPFDGGTLAPCLGVVPDLVVDCHGESDGWNELRLVHAMCAARPGRGERPLVFRGIPTGGALVAERRGEELALTPLGPPPYIPAH